MHGDTTNVPTSQAQRNGFHSIRAKELKELAVVPLKKVIQCYHAAEYGDAQLFSLLFNGKCVFDHTAKTWYIWQGHYWIEDREQYIFNLVSGPLASCYINASAELNVLLETSEPSNDVDIDIMAALSEEEEKQGNKKAKQKALVKSLQGRAFALRAIQRVKRVLEYASTQELELSVTADVWDTHPWLLGTKDGVIELRNGTMRNGVPTDYIKTVIPAKWLGLNATCPRFERYLDEVFSDRNETIRVELIKFLQRALGYGVTGIVRERIFLVLYGMNGHNGKDTLMTAIKKTLGDAVGAVSNDVIIAPPKGHNPGQAKPHLVTLQGKRITWASEPDKGDRFNVGQVKFLTGGDTEIVARGLYEKERTFFPTFLLVLLTNHKPHADATDNAFWGRICPVVYNLSYVDSPAQDNERKKDATLNDALAAEASGILAWLVRGCLEWQAAGITIPNSIITARQEYRKEEDTLGIFFEEVCNTLAPEYTVPAGDLFRAYQEWIVTNGLGKGMSGPAFGIEVKKRFKFKRSEKGIMYYGIGLQFIHPMPEEEPIAPGVTPALHPTTSHEQEVPASHQENGHVHPAPSFGVLYPERTKCYTCKKDPTEWVPTSNKNQTFPWDCKNCLEIGVKV
jgi:putative DNA primase/helicase